MALRLLARRGLGTAPPMGHWSSPSAAYRLRCVSVPAVSYCSAYSPSKAQAQHPEAPDPPPRGDVAKVFALLDVDNDGLVSKSPSAPLGQRLFVLRCHAASVPPVPAGMAMLAIHNVLPCLVAVSVRGFIVSCLPDCSACAFPTPPTPPTPAPPPPEGQICPCAQRPAAD
eukprot:gene1625-2853_t